VLLFYYTTQPNNVTEKNKLQAKAVFYQT